MGLEPAYRRGRRPEPDSRRGLAQDYGFLTPEENRRMVEIQERLDRGEIDILQLYKDVSAIFYIESGERPPAEQP